MGRIRRRGGGHSGRSGGWEFPKVVGRGRHVSEDGLDAEDGRVVVGHGDG